MEEILFKLPFEDKKSCRSVFSQWYRLLERKLQYNFLLSNKNMGAFHARKYKVNELQVHLDDVIIPTKLSPTEKATLSSVKKLKLEAVNEVPANRTEIDGDGIRRILRSCRALNCLNFDFSNLKAFLLGSVINLSAVILEHLHTMQVYTLGI